MIQILRTSVYCFPFRKKNYTTVFLWGMRQRCWLRHCASSRQVTGYILGRVLETFHWLNSFGRTMTLGSTQSLTKANTLKSKGGRCVGPTTLSLQLPTVWKSWMPQHLGAFRVYLGLKRDRFTVYCIYLSIPLRLWNVTKNWNIFWTFSKGKSLLVQRK